MITAYGSVDTAIGALKAGAFDFLQKPVDLEQLRSLVDTALKIHAIGTDGGNAETRLTGQSEPMQRLRDQIAKLARSQAPIYISGESGSGKELAARLIHEQGPRGERPFVPVNCGAIPGELMESEFFGHIKGSFTGAVADKVGLFEAAAGGTLFLDEVADLPLSMQVKLLRAIQEKAIRAVGAAEEQGTDVRVLCATHKDLVSEVAEGRFRQDLYYRLNVIELPMPSLRERSSDIPELADQILNRLASDYGKRAPKLSDPAMRALKEYSFPGNVRELENVLERAFTLCEGDRIDPADLQLEPTARASTAPAPVAVASEKSAGSAAHATSRIRACSRIRCTAAGPIPRRLPRRHRTAPDRQCTGGQSLEQDSGGQGSGHHLPRPALPPEKTRPRIVDFRAGARAFSSVRHHPPALQWCDAVAWIHTDRGPDRAGHRRSTAQAGPACHDRFHYPSARGGCHQQHHRQRATRPHERDHPGPHCDFLPKGYAADSRIRTETRLWRARGLDARWMDLRRRESQRENRYRRTDLRCAANHARRSHTALPGVPQSTLSTVSP